MSLVIATMIVAVVCGYVAMVHSYYRKQQRMCATFPYYRLRDKVVWEILENPEIAPEDEELYGTLNKIVHHADRFDWRFISNAVRVATHVFLDQSTSRMRAPTKFEKELAGLVVRSAKDNSIIVRLAFTRFGRFIFLYPITKACYEHVKKTNPHHFESLQQRVETLRGVRRLEAWRHSQGLAAA